MKNALVVSSLLVFAAVGLTGCFGKCKDNCGMETPATETQVETAVESVETNVDAQEAVVTEAAPVAEEVAVEAAPAAEDVK